MVRKARDYRRVRGSDEEAAALEATRRYLKAMCQAIREIRKDLGESQDECALRGGMPRPEWARFERGADSSSIRFQRVVAFAIGLQVKPSTLMERTERKLIAGVTSAASAAPPPGAAAPELANARALETVDNVDRGFGFASIRGVSRAPIPPAVPDIANVVFVAPAGTLEVVKELPPVTWPVPDVRKKPDEEF